MGTLHITFDIPGERALSSYFEHMYHVPDDFRDVWEPMAEDFWQQNEQTFASEGPGWRPLSSKYKAWKERHYPGMPILVRTGALKASLTEPYGEGVIYEVYPQELTLGSDLKTKNGYTLATLHQFGSVKVADHPPKRPPVQITGELQTRWNQRLATWLREEFAYEG
ncbi:phage virion morphogenesis protein [Alicyclobacillus ferrooxydans]|uniref:Uncharacterized protein n=1 Tax=Alicyclobacillus ferrooxydans TaxID=471514 RepID=A0A0P9CG67_9BACL|nr:phage virion morphogenesis protein [Alicyclobacillus ferrooxydans]KPV42020.1 hypothetical protein AN477_19825 [Alicyclobacillus ferrooxydans]